MKPLAERVRWIDGHNPGFGATCFYGGLCVTVNYLSPGRWELHRLGGVQVIGGLSIDAAKAEALRIVQAAVLRAAKEWAD